MYIDDGLRLKIEALFFSISITCGIVAFLGYFARSAYFTLQYSLVMGGFAYATGFMRAMGKFRVAKEET